jgi:hypothetical protein
MHAENSRFSRCRNRAINSKVVQRVSASFGSSLPTKKPARNPENTNPATGPLIARRLNRPTAPQTRLKSTYSSGVVWVTRHEPPILRKQILLRQQILDRAEITVRDAAAVTQEITTFGRILDGSGPDSISELPSCRTRWLIGCRLPTPISRL